MANDAAANPDDGDSFLLWIVEPTPTSIIDEVLQKSYDETGGFFLRLADDNSITGQDDSLGTATPIDPSWSSPFIGKTIPEIVELVQAAPQPLNRQHFAVLDLAEYQRNQKVMVYKIAGREPQGIPCTVEEVALHLIGYDRGTWAESWRAWREKGRSL